MSYAFIDRKCSCCNGEGCVECQGTGVMGSFDEVPDIPRNGDKEFGNRLREARVRRMVSLSELAALMGCKVTEISEIELGITMPTEKQREKLEKWLGVLERPE